MSSPDPNANRRVWSPLEAGIASLAVSAGVCFAVFGGMIWLTENFGSTRPIVHGVPHNPVLLLGVSLLMAQVSLVACWWAGSSLPSHLKTLLAVAGCGVVWALLVGLLPTTDLNDAASAGWAAALLTQAVVVAVGTALFRAALDPAAFATSSRFNILFLLMWMAVVGAVLGLGRSVAESAGWTAADVLGWNYLMQLQAIALANALLAIGLVAALWLAPTWPLRLLACSTVLIPMTIVTPVAMRLQFANNVGASLLEIGWLIGAEGVFFLATAAPLALARRTAGERGA